MRHIPTLGALLAAAMLAAACGGQDATETAATAAPAAAPAPSAATPVTATPAATSTTTTTATVSQALPAAEKVAAVTVASGLVSPWSLAFLPDGRALVTEKAGTFRIVSPDGTLSPPIGGAPPVIADGHGGLLDVKLSPDFARDSTIYFSYAEPVGGGMARTAVARGVLGATSIGSVQVIFRQQPAVSGYQHYGSRLASHPDGTLFVGLGDRQQRDAAQQLGSHIGKVVRIRRDGTVPTDNPFVGRAGALPEIWSYGHRNVQSAAIEPGTGKLWTGEHGPLGGDEINVPPRGANHGWPIITYGREYGTSAQIGEGTTKAGVEPPLHYWVPTSIAPAGMTFYTGDRVPAWKGDLFVGALSGRMLVRLDVRDGKVVAEQRLLTTLAERIRDVKQGPDGNLYLITDATDGRLMRIEVR